MDFIYILGAEQPPRTLYNSSLRRDTRSAGEDIKTTLLSGISPS